MKKCMWVSVIAFAALAQSVSAGVGPGDGLLMVTAGATGGTTEAGEDFEIGGNWFVSYDKVDVFESNSAMFMIGYMETQKDSVSVLDLVGSVADVPDSMVSLSATTIPVYIGGRGWTSHESAVQAYLGLAMGVYFTTIETTVHSTNTTKEVKNMGFGLGVPAGLTLTLGNSLVASGNFMLHWLWSNQYFENNLAYTVSAGLGMKFCQ